MNLDFSRPQLNYVDALIVSIEAIASLVAIIVIAGSSTATYPYLWVLPAAFLISLVMGISVYRHIVSNISKLIISSGYFIKMVITPGLFAMGGYKSFYTVTIDTNSLFAAVALMSLECVFVFVWCAHSAYANNSRGGDIATPAYFSKKVRRVFMLVLIFIVFAMFYVPAISTVYQPFYKISLANASDLRWDTENIVTRGSFSRIIYSLFCYLWPIVRVILPVWLISRIMDKYGDRKISVLLSCLAFLTPFILISNDTAGPVFSVIVAAIFLRRIYGKKTNKIFAIILTVIGVIAVVMLFVKMQSMKAWRGGSGISSFANVLNAYFPGFENYTYVQMIDNSNKVGTLFFDIYYIIPFKETLFGLHGDSLQALFTSTNLTGGQIMPLTAQISHYVTPIIAPFFTVFIANIAMKADYKSKMCDNFWYSFLYILVAIMSSMSIHLYSFSIYINSLFNVALPIYIIIRITTGKAQKISVLAPKKTIN